MAICVNTNSKEFKDLFNSMDISKGTLELVLHQMLNNGELEGRPFPTKEEILERLYPSTFEGSNNLVKLWDIKYSEDRVFGSLNRAIEYSREAIKLFGENNVRVIELKEGAKVVVAQPSRESYVKYILDKESNVTIPGKSKPSSNREILKEDYSRSREFEDKVVRTLASKLAGININNLGKEFSTTIKDTKNSERVQSYINNLKKIYGDTITIKVTEYSNGTTAISYKFKTFNSLYNETTKLLYSNIDTYLESLTPDKIYEEIGRIESNIENSDKEDNLYYINPNKKEEIVNQILKKVVYTKQVIDSSIAWLETLPNTPEDNLFVKDIINWIKRGSMTNFEMYGSIIREAWDFARSKGADMQKFKTAEDLILWSLKKNIPKIDENSYRTYSKEEIDSKFDKFQFSHIVASKSGEPIYIYNVEDSDGGRQQVAQILADTTAKDNTGKPVMGSPWCLSTYNYNKETGIATPTQSSKHFWQSYGMGKRQIAIYKGRPIAFNSSKENRDEWWDFNDTKSEENILDTDITANNIAIQEPKNRNEKIISVSGTLSSVQTVIFNNVHNDNEMVGTRKEIILQPKDSTLINTESYSNIDRELKSGSYIHTSIENTEAAGLRTKIVVDYGVLSNIRKRREIANRAYSYSGDISINITSYRGTELGIDIMKRSFLDEGVFYIDAILRNSYFPEIKFTIEIDSEEGSLSLKTYDNSGNTNRQSLPDNIIDKIKSIIGKESLYEYIESSIKHVNKTVKPNNDIEWIDKSIVILNNVEKIVYEVSRMISDTRIGKTIDEFYKLDHTDKEESTEDTTKVPTKETTEETTETPRVHTTEEAVERRANVQEAYSQSENTERMNTLRREYQKEYEVVSEYSEGTVTTEDVDNVVTQMETGILANMYNEQVRKPINQELNRRLKDILKRFHFEIIEDALMETFGDDILGATDLVQKIIYLASEGKQNAITMPEEFAHSFIALMGNSYRSPRSRAKFPDTKLYSELMDLVGETSIFRQVYILYKDAYTDSKGNPNMMALREEALGQALAAVLLNRDKNVSDKDRTFFTKLKEWFNSIINSIRELFGHKDPLSAERQLYKELDSIADSILDGSYFEKYLKKLDPTGYNRVGVADSVRYDIEHNNGKMIDFMRFVNSLGGTIDGSFAYRAQGTVYRPGLDTLHDIDCVIPLNVHGLQTKYPSIARNSQFRRGYWDSAHLEAKIKETDFYRSIKDKYGDSFHFLATYTTGEDVIVNGVICEDPNLVERFISMSGNFNNRLRNFTEEERNRFYLIDFFMVNRNENRIYQSEETDITMSDYVVPFTAKMKMGRAKDIFDYQNFNPNHRTLYRNTGSEQTIFYQKKDPNKSTTFNPKTAEFYSGGARGADTVWGTKARELGIKVKDYTVKDWDKLPSEWKEKLDRIYKEVVSRLGRREYPIDDYKGKLVRRDMMQAEKADAIFAVGSIGNNGLVNDGTGYATTRGIIRGIPVYLFDQTEGVWKVWEGDKFVKTTQPTLTNNAAVIGTIKINEAGVKAIEDILKSTIESTKTPTTTEKVQWGVTSDNSFEVSTAANNSNVIGDSRFSALNAKFKPGTIIDGVDVGNKTIEYVYQNIIKKSGKGKAPSKDSKLYRPNTTPAPFTLEDFEVRVPDRRDTSGGTIGIINGEYVVFHTIEGAFQAAKMNYQDDVEYTKDEIKRLIEEGKDGQTVLEKLGKAKTEQEAINIANEAQLDKLVNTEAWDAAAPIIRKALEDKYGQSLSKEELEDFSYYEGYLPLWQEWARQNPELIEELREKSKGRILTDRFANKTTVSQARALADILNSTSSTETTEVTTTKETTQFNKLGTLDNPENFSTPQESEQVISSERTILSNEELQYWNKQGVGEMPRILVGSERTDPAFHVKTILDILDGKTTVPEWGVVDGKRTIVNQVSGKDFAGLYLITKHDGLPMLKLLQTKIPKLIHFSITGLGGTKYEPGVMKYNDLLDRISDYIKQGLDPNSVTIRIDPIVPGVTTKEDIETIVRRASEMGIKRIRFSIMDAYPNTKVSMTKLGYDFSTYYGNSFSANKEYIDDICNFMLALKSKYDITLGTCAEAIAREGISKEGCLSVGAVNSMLGTSIEDKGTDNNNQRKLCTCYGGKVDALQYNNKCVSHCVYCYAKHENNAAMRYYNEDGSLKDNVFTRTRGLFMEQNTSTVTTTEETTTPVETSTEIIEPTAQKNKAPRKEEPSVLDKLIKEAEDEQKSREVATANEKYLEQQLKVTRQLDELYSSNISTTEIGDIASQAVFWISDFITDIQEKKDHATKLFGDKFKDVDFSKMSRVEVVKTIGIDTIVDLCRLKLTTKNDNIITLGERRKASIVSKNWGAIMLRAKVIFPDVENFSIIASDNGSFDIEENVSIDLDNSTVEDYNSTNEQTDIAELEGNIQEAWTIEQRTQDILATMSEEVRRALQKCYLLDEKGNILKSKWGINRRVTVRSATNSILRWTQGAYTLEKMVAMLKTKIATNPWIKQIVERLESTDTDKTLADGTKIEASESDFKSQFFGTMYKPFQLYSVVSEVITNEDGTATTVYKSRIVNRNPALRDAISQVTIQYKLGNHPMFTSNGVNKTTLNYLKGVYDQLGEHLNDNFDNIDTINSIATGLTIAASLLGYYSTPEILVPYLDKATFSKMHSTLDYIIKSLENNVNNPNYEPFKFGTTDGIENNVKNFIKPFTESLEDIAVTAFFDSGKMYQSYVQPSYLTKLIQKLKTEDPEVLKEFLDREFGGTEWFYTKETGWRNTWLKMIADEGGKVLEHKVQLNFNKHNYMKTMTDMEYTLSLIAEYFAESARRQDTLVPAWFRVPMMSNKPSSEFIKFYSFRGEFYKDSIVNGLLKIFNQEISRIQTVILRNRDKKDHSYITNFDKNGKRFCFLDFLNTYLDGNDKSSNIGKLLKEKINGTITQSGEVELLKEAESKIREYVEERAKRILNEWEAQGIIEEVSKKIPGVGASIEVARANLENFIWNDTLASMNILQLTITDIAFYKNAEDLQKRLAQIHAPGIRGNESAVDYAGNPVTDGKFRSVKLKDWDGFISNVIENIDIVFNRKIEAVDIERQRCIESAKSILKANGIEIENIEELNIDNSLIQAKIRDYYNNLSEDAQNSIEKVISVLPTLATKKKTLTALKESLTREAEKDEKGNIIVEAGLYRQINVTDAQGYSCPTSYRKKAYIFGKWSRKKEALWKRLRNGTYSTSDLEEAFGEPLKPFVYSRLFKSSGVEKAPIKTLNIPIQYKNSEYLLFMADALLRSEDTGRPNILRALYDVMENSHFNPDGSYRTDGIDTIQFESTTKSGLMGAVDITEFLDNPNGEAIAREIMLNNLYKREEAGEIEEVNPETGKKEKRKVYNRSTEYNTDTVDIIPFEDYCIQQEIPEHFMNHEQAHGSQARYLTISELDFYNYKGEEVKYKVEIDGEMKEVSPKEFIEEYERNIAANIEEKVVEVMDDLGLNNFTSIKDRNIALSKILQREILSSSRYGIDLLLACSLNEDGTFRIPLGDPIQSKRIEQLINSIIKNRVNKQEVPGGPVVQVSNFGTSRMLNIKFKDKDGNLLLTRDEFNEAKKKGTIKGYNTYNDYIKENQRGIAYFEVFAPAYTKEFFKEFMNSDGEVDVEAINQISPELLKMVGYRIPTEDKYSIAPLKIVGFLPREAGNAIMMPNDITLINGSDFDIDKMYLMVKKLMIAKRFTVEGNKTMSEAEADYIKHNIPSLTKVLDEAVRTNSNLSEEDLSKLTKQRIKQFLKIDLRQSRQLDDAVTRELRKAYINYMYYAIEPNRNSRDYRNNKIVDMTFEVLTHETSTDKVLNPGGFDPQKKMGYVTEAYKNGAATPRGRKYTYQELEAMSIEELKDLSIKGKNLCFIDTQVQFYRQNSAAGSLISIFAVNRTAHAVLESANTEGKDTKYKVNVDEAAKIERPFTVCGMTFGGFMNFDMRYDIEGNLIGKTLGSLVASAVDAVKDPILNLMNINSNTSNILTSLVRMGMPFEKVALFLSQKCITNILREYSKENIGKSKSLTSIIKERLEKLEKELKVSKNGNLAYEELTEEQLIKGLIEEDTKHEFKVLNTFLRFNGIANALRLPTLATRFNSISSAVGPLVIDNLIMEHKINKLNNNSNIVDENYKMVTVQQIVNDHPILSAFRTAYDVANRALSSIPANSRGFRNIMYSLEEILPNLSDTIFNDRKLFGQLSDFYQTALLYRTGVVSRNELSYFINEFPKEFLDIKKELREKEEYKDNALLNAMRVTTEGEGENSRIVLKIDLTGIDITEKTRLSDAWIDLHKLNPELSIKLFKYCVYRGGIGFNPKTFMNLLPIYIRERISGYTSTYEKLPSVDSQVIIEQFVRNNWGNDYLVPRYKIPSGDLTLSTTGYLLDRKSKQAGYISRKDYIKTRINNKDHLFMVIVPEDSQNPYITLIEVEPLGNNGHYVEIISEVGENRTIPENDKKALEVPTTAQDTSESIITDRNTGEAKEEIDDTTEYTEQEKIDILYNIFTIEGVRDRDAAKQKVDSEFKSKSDKEKSKLKDGLSRFIESRLKTLGIKYDAKLVEDLVEKLCY